MFTLARSYIRSYLRLFVYVFLRTQGRRKQTLTWRSTMASIWQRGRSRSRCMKCFGDQPHSWSKYIMWYVEHLNKRCCIKISVFEAPLVWCSLLKWLLEHRKVDEYKYFTTCLLLFYYTIISILHINGLPVKLRDSVREKVTKCVQRNSEPLSGLWLR